MAQADVNGVLLNYRFDGPEDGEIVMLSNSLASNLAIWELQLPALTGAGYRVLRYDTRGHGRSATPAGPYTIEMLAADALYLMDFLGLERVHFCGLSLGGMIGQMLGAGHSDRLHSLILCDTAVYMPFPIIWDERIRVVRERGLDELVEATVDRWFTKPGQERLRKEMKEIRAMILDTPTEGYCGCCAAIRNLDLRDAVGGIFAPTLIIVGEQDQGTPVSEAEFIRSLIPASRLTVIPDAAHFAHMEQDIIFNSTLLAFLRDTSSRKG